MKKQDRKRGSSRMREQGYKLVSVWLDANEQKALDTLAGEYLLKRATLLRRILCEAARISFVAR